MVRTQIIELILATDMKGHFETVSRFRVSYVPQSFRLYLPLLLRLVLLLLTVSGTVASCAHPLSMRCWSFTC